MKNSSENNITRKLLVPVFCSDYIILFSLAAMDLCILVKQAFGFNSLGDARKLIGVRSGF